MTAILDTMPVTHMEMGESVEVLYKYMSAERILACLPDTGDGTLRATQPASLNDPFECAVQAEFIEFGWDELNRDREFAEALVGIRGTSGVSDDLVHQGKDSHGGGYLRRLFVDQLSQRFGIVSFSTNPRDPLMWSHYADGGSGFVVGYDVECLKRLGRENSLQPVHYLTEVHSISDYGELSDSQQSLNFFLSIKSWHWRYESEQRLIVDLRNTEEIRDTDCFDFSINLLTVPNNAVVSVYHTEPYAREVCC